MGRTAIPMVISGLTVVKGQYGPYVRSKHNIVTSPRLAARNACIASQMRGQPGSQEAIHQAFRAASAACRGGAGAPAAGRRMTRRGRF